MSMCLIESFQYPFAKKWVGLLDYVGMPAQLSKHALSLADLDTGL